MPNDNIKYALSQGLELRSVKNILGIPIGEERVYTIERVLGQGGFGITYLASRRIRIENTPHRILFAVKEFFVKGQCWREANNLQMKYSPAAKSEIDECKKGFIDEAKRLNKICAENINIVNVNEVFEANDTAYYVMEFLSGGSLKDIIRKNNGAITEKKALSFILPIAKAVDHIHSQHKLLHCDISPDNIMLRENDNGSFTPVLIDFGVSLHFNSKGEQTTTHHLIGAKEGFAPIELFAGVTSFEPKIDIYALGATLFCLLTGKKPISASDIDSEYISKRLSSAVSQPIRDAILQAMAKNKENRTATVTDFIKNLGGEIMETLPDELSEGDVLINKGKAYVVISVARKKSYYIQYKIVVKDEIRQDSLSGPTKLPICYLYEFFAEGNHERQADKSVINKGDIKKAQQQFLSLCKKITKNQIDNEFKEISESYWSTFVANGTQYIVGYYYKKPFPWKKTLSYAGIIVGCLLLIYTGISIYNSIKEANIKEREQMSLRLTEQMSLRLTNAIATNNADSLRVFAENDSVRAYLPYAQICFENGNYETAKLYAEKAKADSLVTILKQKILSVGLTNAINSKNADSLRIFAWRDSIRAFVPYAELLVSQNKLDSAKYYAGKAIPDLLASSLIAKIDSINNTSVQKEIDETIDLKDSERIMEQQYKEYLRNANSAYKNEKYSEALSIVRKIENALGQQFSKRKEVVDLKNKIEVSLTYQMYYEKGADLYNRWLVSGDSATKVNAIIILKKADQNIPLVKSMLNELQKKL